MASFCLTLASVNGSRLQSDDFLQDYTLLINVLHVYVSLARCDAPTEYAFFYFCDMQPRLTVP